MNEHRNEAVGHLRTVARLDELGETADAALEAKVALAEATLALADEQRTANLIAQRAYVRDFLIDTRILAPGPKRDAMIPLLAEETKVLGDRIRKALDLHSLHRTDLGEAASANEDGLVP